MEFEKNYQSDKDYLNSLEKEKVEISKFEAFDTEYARSIFEKALMDEFKNCVEDEDAMIKRIKIVRIAEEIGFQSLANTLIIMM